MIVHQFSSNALLDVNEYVLHYKTPTISGSIMCRQISNPRSFTTYPVEFVFKNDVWVPQFSRALGFTQSAYANPPAHLWEELTHWTRHHMPAIERWLLRCPTTYRKVLRADILEAAAELRGDED